MTRADLNVFKERRNERYVSADAKIRYYDDESQSFKNETSKQLMSDVRSLVKEFTVQSSTSGENASSLKYLDVKAEDKNTFVEGIIDKIREAGEINLQIYLKQHKKELVARYLDDNIEDYEEASREKYINAINLLIPLAMSKGVKELENNLYEIKKDLIACIDYNAKIEKEIAKIQTEDFIDNCLSCGA